MEVSSFEEEKAKFEKFQNKQYLKKIGSYVPLSFERYDFRVDINEQVAQIKIDQTYKNNEDETLEVVLRFPMDPENPISRLYVVIGDTILEAQIMEKVQAQEKYDDAVAGGKQAFMASETESDFIELNIGNLKPFEKVQLNIEMTTILTLEQGCYCFKFPSQYFQYPFKHLNGLQSVHTLIKINALLVVTSRFKIKYAHCLKGFKITKNQDDFKLMLTNEELTNHDLTDDSFLFYYRTSEIGEPCLLAQESPDYPDQVAVILSYQPIYKDPSEYSNPLVIADDNEDFQPQERVYDEETDDNLFFIFIVDQSGSMSGTRNDITVKALKLFLQSLPPQSYFQLIAFGSRSKVYEEFSSHIEYNDETLDEAIKYIEKTYKALMGSTNITEPLQVALNFNTPNLIKRIFLLTDGEDDCPSMTIQLVKDLAQKPKIFTFGIGSDSGEKLIRTLAELTKGECQIVHDNSQLKSKIVGSLAKALAPSLKEVDFKVNCPLTSSYPNSFKFDYLEQNDQVCLFFTIEKKDIQNLEILVDVKESKGSKYFIKNRHFTKDQLFFLEEGNSLFQLLSRKRINHLQTENEFIHKNEIIELSLKYQVLSKCTSFIAVNKKDAQKMTSKETVKVSMILPNIPLPPNSMTSSLGQNQIYYQQQLKPIPKPPMHQMPSQPQMMGNYQYDHYSLSSSLSTSKPPIGGVPSSGTKLPPMPPPLIRGSGILPPPVLQPHGMYNHLGRIPPPPMGGMPPSPQIMMHPGQGQSIYLQGLLPSPPGPINSGVNLPPPPGMAMISQPLSFSEQISQASSKLKSSGIGSALSNQFQPLNSEFEKEAPIIHKPSIMDQLKQQIMLRKSILNPNPNPTTSIRTYPISKMSLFCDDDESEDDSSESNQECESSSSERVEESKSKEASPNNTQYMQKEEEKKSQEFPQNQLFQEDENQQISDTNEQTYDAFHEQEQESNFVEELENCTHHCFEPNAQEIDKPYFLEEKIFLRSSQTKQALTLDDLIDKQSTQGFWKSCSDLASNMITDKQIIEIRNALEDLYRDLAFEQVVATLIAIAILRLFFSSQKDEWVLIEKKAKNYLKNCGMGCAKLDEALEFIQRML